MALNGKIWRMLLWATLVLYIVVGCSAGNARRRKFRTLNRFFEGYRTLEEINSYMRYMVRTKSNATVTLHRIGSSVEGRPIRCLRIQGVNLLGGFADANETIPWSSRSRKGNRRSALHQNRGVLLIAGVHGREWVTTSAVLYAASRVLEAYGNPLNKSITEALDHAALHIIAVVNPDGYAYTWRTKHKITHQRYRIGSHTGTKLPRPAPLSRLWRGNRRKLGNGYIGVDLNRNWGNPTSNWGTGVSKTKSVNYQGSSGFSEPELRAVRFYANKRHDINFFVDVHCCSQNVKAPFALNPYNRSVSANIATTGSALAEAMRSAQGRRGYWYAQRPLKRKKYSSGISTGWGYTEMGWEDSFTIELGAKGGKFIMPAKWILIQAEEMLSAVKVALVKSSTTQKTKPVNVITPFTRGENSKKWQQFLQQRKYFPSHLRFSSVFGPVTIKATKAWQRANEIEETGFLDFKSLALAIQQGFDVSIENNTKAARPHFLGEDYTFLSKFQIDGAHRQESASENESLDEDHYYGERDDSEENHDILDVEHNHTWQVQAEEVIPPLESEELLEISEFKEKDDQGLQSLKEVAAEDEEDWNLLRIRAEKRFHFSWYPGLGQAGLMGIGYLVLCSIAIGLILASEALPNARVCTLKPRALGVALVALFFVLRTAFTVHLYYNYG